MAKTATIINKLSELATKPTPMMEQYRDIKLKYTDTILMYRLGDFYEMFFEDAATASRDASLTLTGRDCGNSCRALMCGVPHHKVNEYIAILVSKGHKVAICEQVENPAEADGIVKRDIIRIVTPGTVTEDSILREAKNNYLCAINFVKSGIALAFFDVSTGELSATYVDGKDCFARAKREVFSFSPSEILLNVGESVLEDICSFAKEHWGTMIEPSQKALYEPSLARDVVYRVFQTDAQEMSEPVLCAVGALLLYTEEMQKSIAYARTINIYEDAEYMQIDTSSARNLELTESMKNKDKRGTLLWVLDKTKTAMGARLLTAYILRPSIKLQTIIDRQDAVETFYSDFVLRTDIRELLTPMLDIERLLTRIAYGSANARDLSSLAMSIHSLPAIRALLAGRNAKNVRAIYDSLDTLDDIADLLDRAISENPPLTIREGGMIRKGYDDTLDNLRSIKNNSDVWLARLEEREREESGIKNLRVSYNKVFGYYIEVTKSQIDMVPERYIRKQTLTNCERYITEELKSLETEVLTASERVCAIEYDIFTSLRETVASNAKRIQSVAMAIAELDVYLSLAEVAQKNNYVRPDMCDNGALTIREGRHPVVEKFVTGSYFVPNDTSLTDSERLMLITGPNMAGKSTYMRQVAIISLMAQIGSFVPAVSARLPVVDKIFTRVGASDDLASGQSTFMLEMTEVSNILRNATKSSLIIYDEVGRGTSTYDGMSIARAVCEYTARKIRAKTLFATHYHELTVLEGEEDGIVNYNIAAKKKGDALIFLRKIVRGATDDSYGIEVAKLAGLPSAVVERAKEILLEIESGELHTEIPRAKQEESVSMQFDMLASIDSSKESEVADKLRAADINTLTPIEAMNLIYELKKILKS